jgi:hypothetical protein
LVNNLDERYTPVAGCAEIAIEDQRSIDGGWSWGALAVGAGFAAGILAAPELLVVAAAAGVYELATN